MSGTKDDPRQLTTAPGSSGCTIYRDDSADLAAVVPVVASTTLRASGGDRAGLVLPGGPDKNTAAAKGTVEAGGRMEHLRALA